MGVFDGHGGPACSQVVSRRMLNYIAASLLPADVLKQYVAEGGSRKLIETINDRVSYGHFIFYYFIKLLNC